MSVSLPRPPTVTLGAGRPAEGSDPSPLELGLHLAEDLEKPKEIGQLEAWPRREPRRGPAADQKRPGAAAVVAPASTCGPATSLQVNSQNPMLISLVAEPCKEGDSRECDPR